MGITRAISKIYNSQCPHCGEYFYTKSDTIMHLNQLGYEYDDLGGLDQCVVEGWVSVPTSQNLKDYCRKYGVKTYFVPDEGFLICLICGECD